MLFAKLLENIKLRYLKSLSPGCSQIRELELVFVLEDLEQVQAIDTLDPADPRGETAGPDNHLVDMFARIAEQPGGIIHGPGLAGGDLAGGLAEILNDCGFIEHI